MKKIWLTFSVQIKCLLEFVIPLYRIIAASLICFLFAIFVIFEGIIPNEYEAARDFMFKMAAEIGLIDK